MSHLEVAVAIYCAYLVGSLSSAIIVCKLMRLPDPRTVGSHNPGATNVLRIGGKKAAFITLLGDMLKGLIPVLIAKWYGFDALALSLIALGAFLGHLFPIFFRFEGGKGVATFLGCLIGLAWPAALFWLAIWILMAVIFRYSSLAAITASILTPIFLWWWENPQLDYPLVFAAMTLLLLLRHRSNLANLIAGTETKIGANKKT